MPQIIYSDEIPNGDAWRNIGRRINERKNGSPWHPYLVATRVRPVHNPNALSEEYQVTANFWIRARLRKILEEGRGDEISMEALGNNHAVSSSKVGGRVIFTQLLECLEDETLGEGNPEQ